MNKRPLFAALAVCFLASMLFLSSCGERLPGDLPTSKESLFSDESEGERPASSSFAPATSSSPSDGITPSLPFEGDPTTPEDPTTPDEELTPEQRSYRTLLSFIEEKGASCGGSPLMANGLTPSFLRGLSKSYDYQGGAVRNVYIGVMQGELCLFYDAKGFQCRVLFQNGGASAEVICHASTYRCTETLTCAKAMDPTYFNGTTEFFNGGPFSDYEPRYNMLTLLDRCDAILKEQGSEISLKDLGYEHMNAEIFALEYIYK